jgi:very-short-patch-repair endonuclease
VERSKYWSVKNTIKPIDVSKNNGNKYWFDCDVCGKDFYSKLNHVTTGSWCPHCFNKTEKMFFDKLIVFYPTLKRQFKKDWCKNVRNLIFDFVIEDLRILIEIDGPQHFIQVRNWQSPEITKKNDLYKMNCANENGFCMIRILQTDVYRDKYDWVTEIRDNIEKIKTENRVQNIYMCKKDEYKDFDIILEKC